jgi:hypothetical protein
MTTEFKHIHKELSGRPISEINVILHQDLDLTEMVQEFRQFLLAIGFHPEGVEKHIESEK